MVDQPFDLVDCGTTRYITADGLSSVFSPSECLRLTNPVESNVTVSVARDASDVTKRAPWHGIKVAFISVSNKMRLAWDSWKNTIIEN